jgi:hypothetical protein
VNAASPTDAADVHLIGTDPSARAIPTGGGLDAQSAGFDLVSPVNWGIPSSGSLFSALDDVSAPVGRDPMALADARSRDVACAAS